MGFYDRLGARVKSLREKSGITQNELARLLNVKRTTVVQMEKGRRKICTDVLPFHQSQKHRITCPHPLNFIRRPEQLKLLLTRHRYEVLL